MNITKLRKELQPKGPGLAFFDEITESFDFRDAHHLRLLTEACKCLDEESRMRKEIAKTGDVITDRFGQRKPHFGYQTIKDCRILFSRLLRELRLDGIPHPEDRPPRLY